MMLILDGHDEITVVTSYFDYYIMYMGLLLETVWKLQWVQNEAARLFPGVGYRKHTHFLLKQLRRLPICFWAQFKLPVVTYEALSNLDPSFLKVCGAFHTSQL